jgi:hypothetical protein
MITTSTRHEAEVDTRIEATYIAADRANSVLGARMVSVLRSANARQLNRAGTRWSMTFPAALAKVEAEAADEATMAWHRRSLTDTLDSLVKARAEAERTRAEYEAAEAEYSGWSRFFMVAGGHIHSSMSCSTCNNGEHLTQFGWLPELSGLTEADAVAAHGALLCTVCFPSAPVEWTNGRELEAAAKAADKCTGRRDYSKPSRQGYVSGNWGTCDTCGQRVTTTSTGKLRAHKPAAK